MTYLTTFEGEKVTDFSYQVKKLQSVFLESLASGSLVLSCVTDTIHKARLFC